MTTLEVLRAECWETLASAARAAKSGKNMRATRTAWEAAEAALLAAQPATWESEQARLAAEWERSRRPSAQFGLAG